MSKNAPDFSGSFQLVQDQLAETEQRLQNGKQESPRTFQTQPTQQRAIQNPGEPVTSPLKEVGISPLGDFESTPTDKREANPAGEFEASPGGELETIPTGQLGINPKYRTSSTSVQSNLEQQTSATPQAAPHHPREQRRNLTLKVLESNEAEFNRLFHRLQLAGSPRRKQDLADEALQLLFAQYPNQS